MMHGIDTIETTHTQVSIIAEMQSWANAILYLMFDAVKLMIAKLVSFYSYNIDPCITMHSSQMNVDADVLILRELCNRI